MKTIRERAFTAKKCAFILCKDCTKAGFFSAKLVTEWKKPSAKCIWCITYTSTGDCSGKLTGMNKTGIGFGYAGENTLRVPDTTCAKWLQAE
ncbi:MAG: hypothetical protein WCS94_19070 [Verrucomicrobiota bacterium]